MNGVIIMKKSKNLSLSICALALILSGCGGGGSSNTMMPTDNGMTGGTDTGMTGGNGMEPPVHTPTLAEVYSLTPHRISRSVWTRLRS